MEIQIEEALNLNLGSPALQYKVMPAKLGNGRKGFVAFYSACYDVDVHYSMFVVPSDTLHGIAFDEHGEVLWKKELGIWPSAEACSAAEPVLWNIIAAEPPSNAATISL